MPPHSVTTSSAPLKKPGRTVLRSRNKQHMRFARSLRPIRDPNRLGLQQRRPSVALQKAGHVRSRREDYLRQVLWLARLSSAVQGLNRMGLVP
mmetsp:Transcript_82483/g.237149  ORF Transcript_82483/g.237149 Transcript_82483/m.237149 type:complete len:93 (-) Transcript_82483:884-1162(-)